MSNVCSILQLAVWDLGSRQLLSSLPTAHDGPVSAVAFLPGQPLLLTAGGDNALRQWIFDQGDGSPRLLRHRAGHKYVLGEDRVAEARVLEAVRNSSLIFFFFFPVCRYPPRRARYYGGNTVASLADGASGETCQLLSFGGQDRSLWFVPITIFFAAAADVVLFSSRRTRHSSSRKIRLHQFALAV